VQGVVSSNLAIPTNQKPYEIVRLFLWAQAKLSLSVALIKKVCSRTAAEAFGWSDQTWFKQSK